MSDKILGKISRVKFGIQGSQLGLHLTFTADGLGVGKSHSVWDFIQIRHTEHSQWTEEHRAAQAAEIMMKVSSVLNEANVSDVVDLINTPVELTVQGGSLKCWRVLTEVI